MSSLDIEKLLQQVSPESPCGDDLEYDPAFGEMERASLGKPEHTIGDATVPAEDPDWRAVRDHAVALLQRSKDLRLAVYLTRALFETASWPGLRDGLGLVSGLLQRYWDDVHPRLDPDDDNDPTLRINTLLALCDSQTVVKRLREIPIVSSRTVGRFGLRDLDIATGKMAAPAGLETPPEKKMIDAAFLDVDLGELQATADAVRAALDHAARIESTIAERIGVGAAPDLAPVKQTLASMGGAMAEYLSMRGVGVADGGEIEGAGGAAMPGGAPGPLRTGEIRSREDVVRTLDRLTSYYEQNEPSSPVPLLLQRAKRLVSKSFMEIVQDLVPDAVGQAEVFRGSEGGSE